MKMTMGWIYEGELRMARCPGRTFGIALLPKIFHFPRNYVLLSKLLKDSFFQNKLTINGAVYYCSPATIESIVFFSDLHPEGLVESLRALPPTTAQLGLIAASTHFISGRPVTLCRDGSFFGEGAVGIAILKQTNKTVSSHVDFLGIRKISEVLTVTR